MAFFKSILKANLPYGHMLIPRSTISRQYVFLRHLFVTSDVCTQARNFDQKDILKRTFDISEKSGGKNVSKSDPVATIANQIAKSMKGISSETEVLDNYSRYKETGMLSDGDFVRVLVRLAKSRHQPQKKTLENNAAQLYESLLEDIKKNMFQLKEFQLADIIWSLGKLNITNPEFFVHFGNIVESKQDLNDFSNADLSMILWGHGKTNNASPILFTLIQKEILRRGVEKFTTRELCQIVWSFARVMRTSAKLFAAVREVIQKRNIAEFNNQDLIMLMWAYSEAGVNVKPLFRYFKSEILNSKRLSEYGTKHLSIVMWTFANQGIKAKDLFAHVERVILSKPRIDIDDQSLVIIAWSYAQTDNKSPRVFKFLENQLMLKELRGWSLHRLARILWSFTKTGFLTTKLLQKVSTAMLLQDFAKFPQNSLEEVAFALQLCEHRVPSDLVSAVEAELMKRAKETQT